MPIRKSIVALYIIGFLLASYILNNFIILKDINEKRYALHTITEIHILACNKPNAHKAIAAAYERIKDIENKVNYFSLQSELSTINQYASYRPVPLSDDMYTIITRAIQGSQETQGAFDITTTPITRLYGFGKEKKQRPSNDRLQGALTNVGYTDIIIDQEKRTISFKKKGMLIDLGGIAKGYATDEAVKVLKAHGIKNGLVNAGGNIYAFGKNRGRNWTIAIRDPKNTDKTTTARLELHDQGCATSGDYEQYFYENKQKISHIFNPKTGMPSNLENGISAVTVVTQDATEADIMSTSCFVLGPTGSAKVLPELKKYFYY